MYMLHKTLHPLQKTLHPLQKTLHPRHKPLHPRHTDLGVHVQTGRLSIVHACAAGGRCVHTLKEGSVCNSRSAPVTCRSMYMCTARPNFFSMCGTLKHRTRSPLMPSRSAAAASRSPRHVQSAGAAWL